MRLDSSAVELRERKQLIDLKFSNAAGDSNNQLLELREEKLINCGPRAVPLGNNFDDFWWPKSKAKPIKSLDDAVIQEGPMREVNVHQAKTHLSRLVDNVAAQLLGHLGLRCRKRFFLPAQLIHRCQCAVMASLECIALLAHPFPIGCD